MLFHSNPFYSVWNTSQVKLLEKDESTLSWKMGKASHTSSRNLVMQLQHNDEDEESEFDDNDNDSNFYREQQT